MDEIDFHPIRLFVKKMNYSIGTDRIVHISLINKLLFLVHFNEPVGWLFFTQHRETLLVQTQNTVKVVDAIHVCGHVLFTLPVGRAHLCSQQEQSFSVRARVSYKTFSIQKHFIFLSKKQI